MGIIKKIKKRRKEKRQRMIIHHSAVMLGFNLTLTLGLFFTLLAFSTIALFFPHGSILLPFLPLVAIFIFAAASAIVWFRHGQIMAGEFKKQPIFSSSVVVLISVMLLLLLLVFFTLALSAFNHLSVTSVLAFLGALFITLMAIVFELPVVLLGAVTYKK